MFGEPLYDLIAMLIAAILPAFFSIWRWFFVAAATSIGVFAASAWALFGSLNDNCGGNGTCGWGIIILAPLTVAAIVVLTICLLVGAFRCKRNAPER